MANYSLRKMGQQPPPHQSRRQEEPGTKSTHVGGRGNKKRKKTTEGEKEKGRNGKKTGVWMATTFGFSQDSEGRRKGAAKKRGLKKQSLRGERGNEERRKEPVHSLGGPEGDGNCVVFKCTRY